MSNREQTLNNLVIVTGNPERRRRTTGSEKVTWNAVIDAEIFDPRREALVEPEMRPPFHRDQVAEPLMSQLVANNQRDALL